MSTLTCKNCQALENITIRKVNWFNLLSAENISLHLSLATTRGQIRRLEDKLANLQKSQINDQQEIVRLYMETEYLKCQLNKNTKPNQVDAKKLSPLIDYQNKIQTEQLMLIQNEQDLWKRQSDSNIKKLEEHMTILLEELEICHRELINQTKYYLNERHLFRELSNEEKLKSELQLNSALKENIDVANLKIQTKFDSILKYKDQQLKRQEDLISVLRKQQEAINSQFHKLAQNKDKAAIHYKHENHKLKEELEKFRFKYGKLEERRLLEAEGYRTQIKILNNDKQKIRI